MWHVSSCSGVATLRTAIHLLLTYTHTHTLLTALFPGLPGWAGTRKLKPIWILLKQETVSGSWAVCKSAPRCRQITTPAPHHSVFTGRMPFLPPNQQRQSTEGTMPDVCLSVRDHISGTTCLIFTRFLCVLPIYGRGSVLWRRSDTLRISGFADDVIFAHKLIGCSTSPPG